MNQLLVTTILAALSFLAADRALLQAQEADAKLDRFFKQYLDEHFRQRPVEATRLGDHRFDNLLDDLFPKSRDGWVAHARKILKELPQQVDYSKLSRDAQIDFEVFKHDLERTLWLAENTDPFEEDPRVYGDCINDSIFILLAQSTLPKETNIANSIVRMGQIPAVVAAAIASLKHPPRPILETASRQNRGSINFFEHGIFDLAGETPRLDALTELRS